LVVDAATMGQQGRDAFERVMAEAGLQKHLLAGILVVRDKESECSAVMARHRHVGALRLPTTVGAIGRMIDVLLGDVVVQEHQRATGS
jgi:hypothetical protein